MYPLELCKTLLRGIRIQLIEDGVLYDDAIGMMAGAEELIHKCDPELNPSKMRYPGGGEGVQGLYSKIRDVLTGQLLDPELVRLGREAEMSFLQQWQVYSYADWDEAKRVTGKPPISTKWVHTNKGDDLSPNVSCRWVAREFRDDSDVIFAATVPYEAIRLLLSAAAAKEDRMPKSGRRRLQILMVDIKRAYFNARVDKGSPVYVELPSEDPMSGRGKCGRFNHHLYGARGAAAGWEDEYTAYMCELGFRRGLASGCLFCHPSKDLQCAVYGDNFTTTGAAEDLDWLEDQLEKKYAITMRGRLGPAAEDKKETIQLNRVVRWIDGEGLEIEADPRQGERLVAQLGLDGANALTTPGVKASIAELEVDEPIHDQRAHVYRAAVARGNYMSMDRPENQYSNKECCRSMSAPTEVNMKALKRLGIFIIGQPRVIINMKFCDSEFVDVFVDGDWAGCTKTRKSTIGGCVLVGGHLIKSWSSTQATLSLSSGEAEHYALVRGVGIGLGIQELLKYLGVEKALRVHTDLTVAQEICKRVGLGTQRHIATNTLWFQEKLRRNQFLLYKVLGDENPTDMMTKHLAYDKICRCMSSMNIEFRQGRPTAAPERKNKEDIAGENLDWHHTESARNELRDQENESQLDDELIGYNWGIDEENGRGRSTGCPLGRWADQVDEENEQIEADANSTNLAITESIGGS